MIWQLFNFYYSVISEFELIMLFYENKAEIKQNKVNPSNYLRFICFSIWKKDWKFMNKLLINPKKVEKLCTYMWS